ncbi:MAG: thioredoxin family protein [Planctomycetota bacterium]
MSRRTTRMTTLTALIACLLMPMPVGALEWVRDFDTGLEEAYERGVPVFVFLCQATCPPSMQMYRDVFPRSKRLEALSRDVVFIVGHLEENPAAFHKAWIQYLPCDFFTPTYIFLDAEGRPVFEERTRDTMHRMVSEEDLVRILEKLLERNGKGLARTEWQKARSLLDRAEAVVAEGDGTAAAKLLATVAGGTKAPRLAERAARRRAEVLDRMLLDEEVARLEREASPEGMAESEFYQSWRRGLSRALAGDVIAGRNEFEHLLELASDRENRSRLEELCNRMNAQIEKAIEPGRIKTTRITFAGNPDPYYEILLTLRTMLPNVERLTAQFWGLTDQGRVFAGYQTYENVKPALYHVVSMYLPFSELGTRTAGKGEEELERLVDVHIDLYAGYEWIGACDLEARQRPAWWETREVHALTCFPDPGWQWDHSAKMKRGDFGLVFLRSGVSPR